MLLTKPVHDACLVEIVGGYLKFDEIARGKADEPLPHLSRDVGEYEMFISKRDPKHGSGQHGDNLSFGFNRMPLNQQRGFVLSQNGVQLQTGQFRIGDLTDSIKAD